MHSRFSNSTPKGTTSCRHRQPLPFIGLLLWNLWENTSASIRSARSCYDALRGFLLGLAITINLAAFRCAQGAGADESALSPYDCKPAQPSCTISNSGV